MTSSTTWTSRAWLAPLVVGLLAAAGWLVLLGMYRFQPTVGTLFLGLAWTSIVVFGLLATRAVQAVVGAAAVIEDDLGDDRRRVELEREKRLLLKAIKEVEFDRDTSKLDAADAKVAIERYRERALEIIALLDDRDRPVAQRIDDELKRRLAKSEPKPEPKPEAKSSPTCASCGLENDVDATFCKRCGQKVGP